jgi:hypothetical protein
MKIAFNIDLDKNDKEELAIILGCNSQELAQKLSLYGVAALREYITMFLGQKVFRRGSDILEYRLFLLIESALEGQIPDEQVVSNLFQTTSTESRSLIRSVMSKYQYQLREAIEDSIKAISVVSPILFKHHIWLFLENQNTIYGGHFLKNFA